MIKTAEAVSLGHPDKTADYISSYILDRLIEQDKNVRYAVFYNCGIIANRKGNYEEAAKFFRNALKIDGTKIDAKINLELSLMNAEKEAKSKENVQNQVSESKTSSTMEESIFARIREYDEKQWKNSEKSENSNSSQDY